MFPRRARRLEQRRTLYHPTISDGPAHEYGGERLERAAETGIHVPVSSIFVLAARRDSSSRVLCSKVSSSCATAARSGAVNCDNVSEAIKEYELFQLT